MARNSTKTIHSTIIGNEIAVDMGTENTYICISSSSSIIKEPSLIAVEKTSLEIVAVGKEAKELQGRAPSNIKIVSPIKNGVVSDTDYASALLKGIMKKNGKANLLSRGKLLFSFPQGASEVEKNALVEVGSHCGARDVHIISASVAGVISQNISTKLAKAQMTINLGAGHTEVAVSCFGEVVSCYFDRNGGNTINESIERYVKVKHRLLISKETAEEIKISVGSAYPSDNDKFIEVRGRHIGDNMPKMLTIQAGEIRPIICECLSSVLRSVSKTCENLSAQISADILDGEIFILGGGANLHGLHDYIYDNLGVNTIIPEKPQECVVLGLWDILSGKEVSSEKLPTQ